MIGKRLGNYEIRGELGCGGMGVVYEAFDLDLERMVALKVLPTHLSRDQDIVSRFRKEARAAARLSHPGIVEIYTIGCEEGLHFFAMELLTGQSLDHILEVEGVFPLEEALKIARHLAAALAHAHAQGFIHRDIKPSNIMIDRQKGLIKLTDFGIAKALEGETQFTATDVRLGTPRYMSPEQVRGEQLDPRSDIFSLGVVLFQMITGRGPFVGDSFLVVMRNILEQEPEFSCPDKVAIPDEVKEILAMALAKSPDDRYQTARDFAQALSNLLGDEIDLPPGSSRKKWVFSGAGAVLLLVVAGWLYLKGSDSEEVVSILPPRPTSSPSPPQVASRQAEYDQLEKFERENPGSLKEALKKYELFSRQYPRSSLAVKATKSSSRLQAEITRREKGYDEWLARGLEAFSAQNWDGAIMAFGRAHDFAPDREAEEYEQKARFEKWLRAARSSVQRGDKEVALPLYAKALSFAPGREDIRGEMDKLSRELDHQKRDQDKYLELVAAARNFLDKGEDRKAAQVVNQALNLKSQGVEALQLQKLISSREEHARQLGILSLDASPSRARIYLNGRLIGRVDQAGDISLKPGSHLLRISASGYRSWEQEVEIKSGKTQTLKVELIPLPRAPEKDKKAPIPINLF